MLSSCSNNNTTAGPRRYDRRQVVCSNIQDTVQDNVRIHPQGPLLPILLQLILWSTLGLLIRTGLLHLHAYPIPPVAAIVSPQVVGCLILGWVNRNRTVLAKRSPNLLIGLSVGLCGSITTFSSFALATYQEFSGIGRPMRTPNENILAGFSIIWTTMGMSIVSIMAGAQFSDLFPILDFLENSTLMCSKMDKLQTYTDSTVGKTWAPLGLCAIVYASVVASWLTGHAPMSLVLGLVLAPVGTLLRFTLSRFNLLYPPFPVGTFTVNMLGSAFLVGLFFWRASVLSDSTSCAALIGLMDGFCGCLTTISTFTMELSKLSVRDGYIYALSSIGISQLLGAVIVSIWTRTNSIVTMQPVCTA
ncbi:hypothetical protein BASA50_000201 [Batrachochytrium salamandrivorans]|uniref:Uncharacterized protein n=1 Tax=Batrachochytrium salamandrivorans TaxID=1357716 RepID=A0ABQ8EUH1_9FUNG|nr:hypothetical protein BASA50_000201 [Batrachochytrium salamandrivorans]